MTKCAVSLLATAFISSSAVPRL